MKFTENLRLAWSCVKANKMRSILTMLGIIIGISSVITISTIGSTLRQTIEKSVSDMSGANQLAGYYYDPTYEYEELPPPITFQDMIDYKKAFSGQVSQVSSMVQLGSSVYSTSENDVNVEVTGSTEGYCRISNLDFIYGRDINFDDSIGRKKVCVVSDLFVKYALGGGNPIGEPIELTLESGDVMTLYIIGVYKYDQNKVNGLGAAKQEEKDISTPLIVPYSEAVEVQGGNLEDYDAGMFYFFSEEGVEPKDLMDATSNYFNRKLDKNSQLIFRCESLEQILGRISKILDVVTLAISVIAAISLIVGGIGVMNIMLVSVVERTKEIGIRKALGAKNKVIEMQFLVEAVFICAIGGFIGIVMGLISGGLVSVIAKALIGQSEMLQGLNVAVTPPFTAIIISFIFSMLVGIIFGLYPARRAARLSPIDALRYE